MTGQVGELLEALRDALDAADVVDARERIVRQAVRANLVCGIVKEHLDRRGREPPAVAFAKTIEAVRDVGGGRLDPPPEVIRGLLP
jgi:hypothetical protein